MKFYENFAFFRKELSHLGLYPCMALSVNIQPVMMYVSLQCFNVATMSQQCTSLEVRGKIKCFLCFSLPPVVKQELHWSQRWKDNDYKDMCFTT